MTLTQSDIAGSVPQIRIRGVHAKIRSRRGSMSIFALAIIAMMTAVSGYCINLAYIELTRSEQRLAVDAASKAATVVLGLTQSTSQATQKAKDIAALHRVAGKTFGLETSDIQFGTATRTGSSRYVFTPGGTLLNAVKVNADLSQLSGGGASLLVFPSVMSPRTINPTLQSIAARADMDLCVVVDRSGSMAWDLSSTPYSYPGSLAGKSNIQNYFELPHASLSRWAALRSAMTVFLDVLDDNPFETRVSLASYSSNFTFGIYESLVSSLDQPLTTNYALISSKLNQIATKPLIGNTNIAAGLREGINSLTDVNLSRITASKTLVLLTDGVLTQGDDPVQLAATAKANNIRVHAIAFSAQADQTMMQNVATAGGGNYYYAPDAATLRTVFLRIAETLPAMLAE